jgi:ABC-type sugar transport system ATPase subunit
MKEGDVIVGFRPEHQLPANAGEANLLKAQVEVIEPMGSEAYVYLKGEKGNVIARVG